MQGHLADRGAACRALDLMAEEAAEAARVARDAEIRRLLDAGWTGARVAVLAGISGKQVSVIRHR